MSLTATLSSATALDSSPRSGTITDAGNGKVPVVQPGYGTLTIPLVILSTFLFIIASLIFSLSVLVLTRLSEQLTDLHLVALYLNSVVYFSLALSSLVGFYYFFPTPRDQKVPKVRWLNLFLSIYASLLVLSLGTSVLCIYLLFQQNPPALLSDAQAAVLTLNQTALAALEEGVGKCAPESLAKAHDMVLGNLCLRTKSLKVLGMALITVGWLVNLGEIILVNAYSRCVQKKIMQDFEKNPCFDDDGLNWHY